MWCLVCEERQYKEWGDKQLLYTAAYYKRLYPSRVFEVYDNKGNLVRKL